MDTNCDTAVKVQMCIKLSIVLQLLNCSIQFNKTLFIPEGQFKNGLVQHLSLQVVFLLSIFN